MSTIEIIRTVSEMSEVAGQWNYSPSIALVPTMGYLHEGHLNLVREAGKRADTVLVSIFVNPMQFGPTEDLDRYPRNFDRDRALLSAAGAKLIFAPAADDITPQSMRMKIEPGQMGKVLCGQYRPGHFSGVTTIVAKLFNIVRPGLGIFGWKDAQQFILLNQMVSDLNLPVRLVGIDTTREPDGLAMSSRNTYLTPAQRAAASAIYRELSHIKSRVERSPGISSNDLKSQFHQGIEVSSELIVQYIEVVSRQTLEPLPAIVPGETLVATAVYAGATRLIDNIRL